MARSKWHQATPLLWYCIIVFAMGDILFGVDTASFGSLQALPSFKKSFGQLQDGKYVIPKRQISLMNSLVWLGRVVGCSMFETVTDWLGYKKLVVLLSVTQLVAIAIQLATENWIALTVGRILAYVAVSLCENSVPSYSSEISPPTLRGFFAGSLFVFNTVGAVWGAGMSNAFKTETGTRGWRIPIAVQMVPAIIMLICIPWTVESPRWLVQRGRREEALVQLRRLRRPEEIDAGLPELEVDALARSIELDRMGNQARWIDAFRGTYWRRGLSIFFLMFGYQVGGNQLWNAYGPTFFVQIGLGAKSFAYSTMVQGVSGVGAIIGITCTDIVGRRWIVLPAGLLVVFFDCLIAGLGHKKVKSSNDTNMIVASFTLMLTCIRAGWQTHSYLMAAELGGVRMRKKMMMVGTLSDVVCAFTVAFCTPYVQQTVVGNARVGYIFGGAAALAFLHNLFFLPEVANRGLEEMDELFDRKPLWGWQYKHVKTSGVGAEIAQLEIGESADAYKATMNEPNQSHDEDEKNAVTLDEHAKV